MKIRRADERDAAALQRLWEASSGEIDFAPYPGAPFEPALVTEHTALVAEQDGELVGCVYANLSSPGFGYVFGLYVVPEARRRGIALGLMRAVARALAEAGRPYLLLTVDTPNESARRLYERLGFADAARMLRIEVDRLLED